MSDYTSCDTKTEKTVREISNQTFAHRTRYIILIISTIALTLTISNSLALNFTIICMVKNSTKLISSNITKTNFTEIQGLNKNITNGTYNVK